MIETIEKLYHSPGEVGAMIGVTAVTIRYWDNVFHVCSKRNRHNNRRFTLEDIEKFRKIKHLLRVRKFTIEGAKLEILTQQL